LPHIFVAARPGVTLLGNARRPFEALAPRGRGLPHGGNAGELLDCPLHILTLEDEDRLPLAYEHVVALEPDGRIERRPFAHEGAGVLDAARLQRHDHGLESEREDPIHLASVERMSAIFEIGALLVERESAEDGADDVRYLRSTR
jgi:hypothetical protein